MNDGLCFALLTVLAWGVWLAPAQTVRFSNERVKIAYVTLANLLLTIAIAAGHGMAGLDAKIFAACFAGGVIWAVSGIFAFHATSQIGIARAMSVWAPLNIVVSIAWGIVLFGEMRGLGTIRAGGVALAVALMIAGIALIVRSTDPADRTRRAASRSGLLAAVASGILWGSYFIPIRLSGISMWVAALPMAVGMFAGGMVVAVAGGASFRLARKRDYPLVCATGVLWGIGNFGSLRMMELLGTGKGFTIAQLCIVVNALVGIYFFRRPEPRTLAARCTLAGVAIMLLGGIVLGGLKTAP